MFAEFAFVLISLGFSNFVTLRLLASSLKTLTNKDAADRSWLMRFLVRFVQLAVALFLALCTYNYTGVSYSASERAVWIVWPPVFGCFLLLLALLFSLLRNVAKNRPLRKKKWFVREEAYEPFPSELPPGSRREDVYKERVRGFLKSSTSFDSFATSLLEYENQIFDEAVVYYGFGDLIRRLRRYRDQMYVAEHKSRLAFQLIDGAITVEEFCRYGGVDIQKTPSVYDYDLHGLYKVFYEVKSDGLHFGDSALAEELDDWLYKMDERIGERMRMFKDALSEIEAGKLTPLANTKVLSSQLDDETLKRLLAQDRDALAGLYEKLKRAFADDSLLPVDMLSSVPQDTQRVNKFEAIIDMYNAKIQHAEGDETLTDASKQRKIEALRHLMEKDIAALGETT